MEAEVELVLVGTLMTMLILFVVAAGACLVDDDTTAAEGIATLLVVLEGGAKTTSFADEFIFTTFGETLAWKIGNAIE